MYIDIVFPDNNEKEFLEIALKLGYGGVCFVYPYKNDLLKINEKLNKLKSNSHKNFLGLLAKPKDVVKAKKIADIVLVKSSSEKQNRYVVEKTKADIIFGIEANPKPDSLHHRNSGLNQVLCKLAAKNKIAIGIPFSMILKHKSKIKGRISQNVKLCRKYKIDMVVASFAHEPFQMRAAKDLESLCIVLGMHPKEAKSASTVLSKRIDYNKKTKDKQIIAEGIEIID